MEIWQQDRRMAPAQTELHAKRELWTGYLQKAACTQTPHGGSVVAAQALRALWLIGSKHLEEVTAVLSAWHLLTVNVKTRQCSREEAFGRALSQQNSKLAAKALVCWASAASMAMVGRCRLQLQQQLLSRIWGAWWSQAAQARLQCLEELQVEVRYHWPAPVEDQRLDEYSQSYTDSESSESDQTTLELQGIEDPMYLHEFQENRAWYLLETFFQHQTRKSGHLIMEFAFQAWRRCHLDVLATRNKAAELVSCRTVQRSFTAWAQLRKDVILEATSDVERISLLCTAWRQWHGFTQAGPSVSWKWLWRAW
eukprot:s1353_g20.t1